MPYRSQQAVTILNLGKAVALVLCAVVAGWLMWQSPTAAQPVASVTTAAPTATSQPADQPTTAAAETNPTTTRIIPTTAPIITATVEAETATPRATAVPVAPSATPTTAVPAVPLTLIYPQPDTPLAGFELTMVGTAAPQAIIEILHDGEVVGIATADERGYWTHVRLRVEAGRDYTLAARLQGETATTPPLTITLNLPTILPPCENPTEGIDLGDRYVVGNCEWMTRIARTAGVDYFELLALNPEIIDPNVVRPGQVLRLPVRGNE